MPVFEAVGAKKAGKEDKEVADKLAEKGHSKKDISSAMEQSKMAKKKGDDPFDMSDVLSEKNEEVEEPKKPNLEGAEEDLFKPKQKKKEEESPDDLAPPSPDDVMSNVPSPEEDEKSSEKPSNNNSQQAGEQPAGMNVLSQQPTMQVQKMQPASSMSQQVMHQIAERVVQEKWEELMGNVGDLAIWKQNTERDLKAVKQEIVRVTNRLENVQMGVLGKVKEYSEDVSAIGSEIKVLENVLQKIIEPLSSNIRELSEITEDLKKKKK